MESESYRKIADSIGCLTSNILFLTDVTLGKEPAAPYIVVREAAWREQRFGFLMVAVSTHTVKDQEAQEIKAGLDRTLSCLHHLFPEGPTTSPILATPGGDQVMTCQSCGEQITIPVEQLSHRWMSTSSYGRVQG